ncbi:MAG TPA: hypothetical protein VH187_03050 [Scandinavium sp.]|jgi:hypothetical protein|uniref:hypothetical protein n=1 Tax=Scandinavium sp. TaxID=2830653 RepID=UPI002E358B67|nr:hypothetical protein [Scandinavium sp.]HEX4500136.1 hypothetical protein [Scandinavium sp.]
MHTTFYFQPSTTDRDYPFNRRLSIGVFILQRRGVCIEKIAKKLHVDVHRVEYILALRRVRDSVVKKQVENLGGRNFRLALLLVGTRILKIVWPYLCNVNEPLWDPAAETEE